MEALLGFAKREPNALLPGYTHLRRAQPILWSHYLVAYFEVFSRDWERFDAAYQSADVLPLGSGALAGSGFPFDRQAMADELGFSRISSNSLDAVSDRDFAAGLSLCGVGDDVAPQPAGGRLDSLFE